MTRGSGIQAPVAPPRREVGTGRPAARDTGEAILETRATFKTVLRSGWRPCRMRLTPNGITLTQGGRPVFDLVGDRIVGLRIEKVRFALGRKREVLRVEYRAAAGKRGSSRVWLVPRDIDIYTLRDRLVDLAAPLNLAAVEGLAPHLDADAESIVRFLWGQRYATIRELAEHTRMPSHMDILLKIREVINPAAEELLGFPLLVFAPARPDTLTGQDVFNSWWILGAGATKMAQRPEIMVDTFDEADGFRILACLPCGEAAEVNVSFSEGQAEISSGEDPKPVRVSLPAGAEPKNCRRTFRNGILELCWDRTGRPTSAGEEGEK